MATEKPSVLSADERAMIVDALELKLASSRRAMKAHSDAGVVAAMGAIVSRISALQAKVQSGELAL